MHVVLSILDLVNLLLLAWFWRLMWAAKRDGMDWEDEDSEGVTLMTMCMVIMIVITLIVGVIAFVVKLPPFIWDYVPFAGLVVTFLCIEYGLLPHEPPIVS